MQLHERIHELALSRSFFFPSYEPYGPVGGLYDYGPVGTLIKNRIEKLWRIMFAKSEGFHELEGSIITPEPILRASGHVENFADPILECSNCKTKIRGDTLIEEKLYKGQGRKWSGRLGEIDELVEKNEIKCPKCGGAFKKAAMFNLMFKTGIGGEQKPAYCRPETAQSIFNAFPRLFRNHGTKLPMGIAQIGKSFRNEISPRKGLVRMREFTQMELEYFFNPSNQGIAGFTDISDKKMRFMINGETEVKTVRQAVEENIVSNEIMAYFLEKEWEFYKRTGISEPKMYFRVLEKGELPHYSKCNIDMEVHTSYGVIETIGNAYRTDYDLSNHSRRSGKDASVHIPEEKKKIMPHVFEVSMGFDRLFFCILEHCYRNKSETKDWEWFDFPPEIAPYDIAVLPLMRKDGLDEKACTITDQLRKTGFDVLYRGSGSIGRRYARCDEIGIPYAITVDYDTLKDNTVTIRYRNDGKQERIPIKNLREAVTENKKRNRVTL